MRQTYGNMATAKNNKNNAVETNNEKTELDALMFAREAVMAAGLDTKAIDAKIEALIGPDRDEAVAKFEDAVRDTLNGVDYEGTMADDLRLMNGLRFAAIFTVNNGEVEIVVSKVEDKKKKSKGNGATRKTSAWAGHVGIVNGAAFKDCATLNRHLGIFKTQASQPATYAEEMKKNPGKYPEPQMVTYGDFFADPDKYAPKGYYETVDKKAGIVKKVPAVQ